MDKIYLVISLYHDGQWGDNETVIERPERAFTTREDAESYIRELPVTEGWDEVCKGDKRFSSLDTFNIAYTRFFCKKESEAEPYQTLLWYVKKIPFGKENGNG